MHMRTSIACLAMLTALAACGPSLGGRGSREPTLRPRNERYVRLYMHTLPRCPFREVGGVWGRTYRDVRTAAFRLHANAVLLEPTSAPGEVRLQGTAVQFTSVDCQY
jgi:hypothetical protein